MIASFDCTCCGQCCEGKGGIVVSPTDLTRLCMHTEMSEKDFIEMYAEQRNGKLHISTAADGYCIFFKRGTGCTVHEGKPDICRAWPFFRGNLVDSESFALAKEFCPGIPAKQSFEAFVQEGKEYLQRHHLVGVSRTEEAGALCVTDIFCDEHSKR